MYSLRFACPVEAITMESKSKSSVMDLYNSIIVTIWLTMLYAVWAATAAGDPGYGQAAFIISGIAGHLYLRKLKLERPVREEEDIEIPNAEFSVEILEEKDKYVISEKAFRKIIWISTILSLILISLFLEPLLLENTFYGVFFH